VREQAAASGSSRAAKVVRRVRRGMASSMVWRRGAVDFGRLEERQAGGQLGFKGEQPL
jgi:hypothetical protein